MTPRAAREQLLRLALEGQRAGYARYRTLLAAQRAALGAADDDRLQQLGEEADAVMAELAGGADRLASLLGGTPPDDPWAAQELSRCRANAAAAQAEAAALAEAVRAAQEDVVRQLRELAAAVPGAAGAGALLLDRTG